MQYKLMPSLDVWKQDSAPFASPASKVAALKGAFNAPNLQQAQRNLQAMPPAPANRAALTQIDSHVATYHRAFSPMAKTNVLNDLRRAIDVWRQAHPGTLPAAMAALSELVDRDLNLRPTASRYNKAICVAYHTYCNYDAANNTVWAHNSTLNKDYFCHSPNDTTDMQQKCGDLWTGITAAANGITAHGLADDTRTLKIFMAPEFYFRGRNGAYDPSVVEKIIPTMMGLGTGTPAYQDWLFVFGTAVAAFEESVTYCTQCPWTGATTVRFQRDPANYSKTIPKCSVNPAHAVVTGFMGAEVQNVALIQHGSDTHQVPKEYVSPIDYKKNLTGQSVVGLDPTNSGVAQEHQVLAPLGGHQRPGAMAVQNDERLSGCIFTMDGLTFGLEVCLDHAKSNNAIGQGRASALAPTIQVLLIPSYGMDIGARMYCKTNGIAFNVDGRRTGSSEVKLNTPPHASQTATVVSSKISLYGPFNIPA